MRSFHSFSISLKFLAIFLLLAATANFAVAGSDKKDRKNSDYALIYGTVWDAHDQPARGISVKIRRMEDKKARWELVSNNLGEFAQRVPVGKQDYVVWADLKHKKGEKDLKPVQTVVHIENNERADTSLHLTE